jgi:hypothetical protein
MRISVIMFAAAALALTGCAEDVPTVKWSKPDTGYDQFVQDRAACVAETRERSQPFYVAGQRYAGRSDALDSGLFISCMTARGYDEDSRGFAAPRSDAFPLFP